jgi:hypothetical protein
MGQYETVLLYQSEGIHVSSAPIQNNIYKYITVAFINFINNDFIHLLYFTLFYY